MTVLELNINVERNVKHFGDLQWVCPSFSRTCRANLKLALLTCYCQRNASLRLLSNVILGYLCVQTLSLFCSRPRLTSIWRARRAVCTQLFTQVYFAARCIRLARVIHGDSIWRGLHAVFICGLVLSTAALGLLRQYLHSVRVILL